ncbi:MAG: hypothetical protein FJ104_17165, partial [Deltaproteobacteria bacterium]|nr:hypothetical protein [Deltaproteobacteria bacterium]
MESQDPAEAIAAPEPPVEAAPTGAPEAAPPTPEAAPVAVAAGSPSPSYVFFGVIAAIALIADVVTKAWAEITLSARPARDAALVLVDDVLALSLAYNR